MKAKDFCFKNLYLSLIFWTVTQAIPSVIANTFSLNECQNYQENLKVTKEEFQNNLGLICPNLNGTFRKDNISQIINLASTGQDASEYLWLEQAVPERIRQIDIMINKYNALKSTQNIAHLENNFHRLVEANNIIDKSINDYSQAIASCRGSIELCPEKIDPQSSFTGFDRSEVKMLKQKKDILVPSYSKVVDEITKDYSFFLHKNFDSLKEKITGSNQIDHNIFSKTLTSTLDEMTNNLIELKKNYEKTYRPLLKNHLKNAQELKNILNDTSMLKDLLYLMDPSKVNGIKGIEGGFCGLWNKMKSAEKTEHIIQTSFDVGAIALSMSPWLPPWTKGPLLESRLSRTAFLVMTEGAFASIDFHSIQDIQSTCNRMESALSEKIEVDLEGINLQNAYKDCQESLEISKGLLLLSGGSISLSTLKDTLTRLKSKLELTHKIDQNLLKKVSQEELKNARLQLSESSMGMHILNGLEPSEARIATAGDLLKRKLNDSEGKALLSAHNIGTNEGRGVGTFTQIDIRNKDKILKEAGFNQAERRTLIEHGIAGIPDDEIIARARRFSAHKKYNNYIESMDKNNIKFVKNKQYNNYSLCGKINKPIKTYRRSPQGESPHFKPNDFKYKSEGKIPTVDQLDDHINANSASLRYKNKPQDNYLGLSTTMMPNDGKLSQYTGGGKGKYIPICLPVGAEVCILGELEGELIIMNKKWNNMTNFSLFNSDCQ